MRVKAPLDADDDGFLTQECPYCNRRFKAAFTKGSRNHLRYCPYCGTQGQNCWYTVEQIEYLHGVAAGDPQSPPAEDPTPLPVHKFACHRESIKYVGAARKLYCIVCGEASSLTSKTAARKAPARKAPARKATVKK
jgi:hypothetical protein